jgi:hypothetical protein
MSAPSSITPAIQAAPARWGWMLSAYAASARVTAPSGNARPWSWRAITRRTLVSREGALAVGEGPHSPRCVLADSGERSERRIVGRHEVAVMLGDACG